MRAAVLRRPAPIDLDPVAIEQVPEPHVPTGHALLKVLACGVCRTDLHIVEGDLPMRLPWVIPGHQIVAQVVSSPDPNFTPGMRVGVSWVGGTDGTCRFCAAGRENLCDAMHYTGYTQPGGFAEYTTARTDFLLPLPGGLSNESAAPLLCAGIIGFRSLRVAEVKPGQNVGLFGFGSSAQLLIHVLHHWDCRVYVSTREPRHQQVARALGARWVGGGTEVPPVALDAAITFAPAGEVVVAALRSLDKGAIVAINAIHLDGMPAFDYDSLLWGERQLRSVSNMTRQDGRDFLKIAAEIGMRPEPAIYSLDRIGVAMKSVRHEQMDRPAVIVPTPA